MRKIFITFFVVCMLFASNTNVFAEENGGENLEENNTTVVAEESNSENSESAQPVEVIQPEAVLPEEIVNNTDNLDASAEDIGNLELSADSLSVEEETVTEGEDIESNLALDDSVFRMPASLPANYNGTVNFVVNGTDVPINFNDGTETVGGSDNRGVAWDTGGFLDKKYFIGWSTDPNYENTEGAELVYSYQKISDAFPTGLTGGEKLYPIFLSRLGVLGYLNNNKVFINEFDSAQETLPTSDIKTDTFDNPAPNREVEVYFDETKDSYKVNLNSSFQLNKILSHWLYIGNGSTIMTNTQSQAGSSATDAKYTHVDLNVELGDEFDVPEEIRLSFDGFFFQPYMVIDGATASRDKLEIAEVTSADKWNIGELVSNTSPVTTFTVKNPNKSKKIIVRTILRTNSAFGGRRIPDVTAAEIENINMRLNVDSTLNPITISKEKAEELLNSGDAAVVTGVVNGYVKMPSYSLPFIGEISLDQTIPDVVVENPIHIKFVEDDRPKPVPNPNPVPGVETAPKVEPKITCADEGKIWDEAKQACVFETSTISVRRSVPSTASSNLADYYFFVLIASFGGILVINKSRLTK